MKNGATTKILRLQVLALTLIQREFDEAKTARDEHRRGHNYPIEYNHFEEIFVSKQSASVFLFVKFTLE